MTEEWRAVRGWEGFYEVSSLGRVRSLARTIIKRNGQKQQLLGRLMATPVSSTGYLCVRLRDESHWRSEMPKVHRLVALAFLPSPPAGFEVNHIDGDKRNSRLDNLEWVTSRGNRKHAWRLGLRNRSHLPILRGEDRPNAKLTETIVRSIRSARAAGASFGALAKEHGVDKRTIRDAISGKTWKGVLPLPPQEDR